MHAIPYGVERSCPGQAPRSGAQSRDPTQNLPRSSTILCGFAASLALGPGSALARKGASLAGTRGSAMVSAG